MKARFNITHAGTHDPEFTGIIGVLLEEIGIWYNKPVVIYKDNQPIIQVANNDFLIDDSRSAAQMLRNTSEWGRVHSGESGSAAEQRVLHGTSPATTPTRIAPSALISQGGSGHILTHLQ
jgi:hypothetical protein